MDKSKLAGMLGLAVRARQVQLGSGRALDCVRGDKAGLVLLDEAASENTKKRFENACQSHQVAHLLLSPGLLGRAVGKPDTMVAALLKGGMAERLRSLGCDGIMNNE